jgi:AraC-like DNA-binding protein
MLKVYYSDPDNVIDYEHKKGEYLDVSDFHLHNRYEIYFFISGNINYFIEKKVYQLKFGDLFVMNSREIHKPSFTGEGTYERIVVHFDPALPQLFNTTGVDLLNCFLNRPLGEQNKIELSKDQVNEALSILKKMERMQNEIYEYSRVLKLTYFIELLVFINKAFIQTRNADQYTNIPDKIINILEYIDKNLENDLSLEFLEKKFYLNGSYLSRLFKNSIGSNIHQYIVYKRISKAKMLLSEGYSAAETCFLCGFNDFSNFSRAFKRTVGIPVRQFKAEVKK